MKVQGEDAAKTLPIGVTQNATNKLLRASNSGHIQGEIKMVQTLIKLLLPIILVDRVGEGSWLL